MQPESLAPDTPRLLICGCGPGELVAWVPPLLRALQQTGRSLQVFLVFWPRLFLSGREAETARQLPGVHRVYPPRRAMALLSGVLPSELASKTPCLVLHMGGPARLSLGLGRRLQAPVLAYCERPTDLPRGFRAVYSADPPGNDAAAGVRPLGNLLVDAVEEIRRRRISSAVGGLTVGLMPGSRALQLRQYLPRISPVAEAVLGRLPATDFLIARSPLVDDAMLKSALGTASPSRLEGAGETLALRTGSGLRIPLVRREQVLARARILVSTPGTNTGEAAALGIPHLVIAPFDESVPLLRGLPGLIERSPWPGRVLKRLLLHRLTAGMRYYALANLRAGREIVPELPGPLDIAAVVDRVTALLRDHAECDRIGRELLDIMGPPGAAHGLAQALDYQLSRLR